MLKRILLIATILLFALSSCGKKDEVKKDDTKKEVTESVLKDQGYSNITTNYDNDCGAFTIKKSEPDKYIYELKIDYKAMNESVKQSFAESKEKIGKYPVRISMGDDSLKTEVEIAMPNEIWVRVSNATDKDKIHQNTELLKKVIPEFDLPGLEKITGDKVTGVELAKYLPKIEKYF